MNTKTRIEQIKLKNSKYDYGITVATDIDFLVAQLEKALEVLKYYENVSRLMLQVRDLPVDEFALVPIIAERHEMDNGDRARALLKEWEV